MEVIDVQIEEQREKIFVLLTNPNQPGGVDLFHAAGAMRGLQNLYDSKLHIAAKVYRIEARVVLSEKYRDALSAIYEPLSFVVRTGGRGAAEGNGGSPGSPSDLGAVVAMLPLSESASHTDEIQGLKRDLDKLRRGAYSRGAAPPRADDSGARHAVVTAQGPASGVAPVAGGGAEDWALSLETALVRLAAETEADALRLEELLLQLQPNPLGLDQTPAQNSAAVTGGTETGRARDDAETSSLAACRLTLRQILHRVEGVMSRVATRHLSYATQGFEETSMPRPEEQRALFFQLRFHCEKKKWEEECDSLKDRIQLLQSEIKSLSIPAISPSDAYVPREKIAERRDAPLFFCVHSIGEHGALSKKVAEVE